MLLFMVQPEFDQCRTLGQRRQAQQGLQGPVHMGAIRKHLFECRAGQQAALGPRLALANRLVIGVEEELKLGVEHGIPGQVRLEHKLFEEPGGMRQMPFGRTCVFHRLHGGVGIA